MTNAELKTFLLASCFGPTLAIAAGTAHAQDEGSSVPTGDVAVIGDDRMDDLSTSLTEEGDQIIVTGSRIARDSFTTAAPVTVISTETVGLAGLVDAAAILQSSTVASGQQIDRSFNGFVTDGGPGATSVGLRGLGASRTLTLFNGKRLVAGGTRGRVNTVNLNTIPVSAIERIEILRDGASSVYGADAVAGVVNLIAKESADGLTLRLRGSTALDDDFSTDAPTGAVEFAYGKTFDRSAFSVSGAYAKSASLQRSDREFSDGELRLRETDQFGRGVNDGFDPVIGQPLDFGFTYGFVSRPFGTSRLDTDDETDPFLEAYCARNGLTARRFGIGGYTILPEGGVRGATPGDPLFDPSFGGAPGEGFGTAGCEPFSSDEGGFLRDARSYQVQDVFGSLETLNLASFGSRDLTLGGEAATAYYEGYATFTETEQTGAYGQFFPQVGADNPFNPFGLNGPLGRFGGFAVQPVAPTYELVSPDQRATNDVYNLFAGVRGDIEGGRFTYDVYGGYGYSVGKYASERVIQSRVDAAFGGFNTTLDLDEDGEADGIDFSGIALNADGTGECSPAAQAIFEGCVAIDPFTEEFLLEGRLPRDAADFLTEDLEGETTYELFQLAAYVTGDTIELPAGTVAIAAGAEYREEALDDQPDAFSVANDVFGFSTAGATEGRSEVFEAYAEVEVPLLADRPGARELTVNGSTRYTDYDFEGGRWTYRGQVNWQVIDPVRLRATYGTSYAPPRIFQRSLGDQTGFAAAAADPCFEYGERFDPETAFFRNCASLGLPEDFAPTAQITTIRGGADDLESETSENYTVGVVFQPSFVDLSVAIDYYSINLDDTVASPNVGAVLNQCFGSEGFSSPFCDQVGPRADFAPQAGQGGELSFVDASFLNLGEEQTEGIDLTVRYGHEFANGWRVVSETELNYLESQSFTLFGEKVDLEGYLGFPQLTGNAYTYLDTGDWRFQHTAFYVGESNEDDVFDPGTDDVDRDVVAEAQLLHAIGARYRQDGYQLTLGVNNVLNEQPDYVADGLGSRGAFVFLNTVPGAGYSAIGRTVFFELGVEF